MILLVLERWTGASSAVVQTLLLVRRGGVRIMGEQDVLARQHPEEGRQGAPFGEINSSQEIAWRRSIEVLDEQRQVSRTLALFPDDRFDGLLADESIVRLRLSAMVLHRPRQWGACWLALQLWELLGLDAFWAERLSPSRKGTRWDLVQS